MVVAILIRQGEKSHRILPEENIPDMGLELKMKPSKMLLALFFMAVRVNSVSQSTKVQVIESVVQHFNCNCVILVVRHHSDGVLIKSIGERLSQRGKLFIAVTVATIADKYSKIQRDCSLPLVTIPGTRKDIGEVIMTISKNLRLTGPVWLVFLSPEMALESTFSALHVPFDSELLVAQSLRTRGNTERVSLTEIYHVTLADKTLRTHAFGSWSQEQGLKGSAYPFFIRRSDLHGLVIEAVMVPDPPLIKIRKVRNRTDLFGGTIGELWRIIQESLNFTFHTVSPTSGLWGTQLPNGSWDGMVGMVLRNETHCALNAFVTNPIFARVIQYMVPLHASSNRVFVRELDGQDVSWSNFLTPFTPWLWLTVLATTLAIAVLTFAVYRLHQHLSQASAISPTDAAFYIFAAIYCNQSHDQSPQALSKRMVYIIVYLLAVIVVSSYSAFLMSSFTVIKPRIPFTSLEGLLEEGTYELGFQKGAYVGRYFQDAKDGLLKDIFDRHIRLAKLPLNAAEGLARLCSQRKYAFLSHSSAVRLLRAKLPCKLFGFPQEFIRLAASFGFCPKGSPYQQHFNHYLLLLREMGISKHESRPYSFTKPWETKDENDGIQLEQVTPILSILVCGVAVGTLCLFGELLAKRWSRRG